jgi:transcriptional regulator with PAS, ATPase and Fis domain
MYAGNLERATASARSGLELARTFAMQAPMAGCASNLGFLALCAGHTDRSREYLNYSLLLGPELSFVRLSALDNFCQVAIHEDDANGAEPYLAQCAEVIASQNLPARSWYDLAHQLTRCAYFDQLEDYERIVAIAEDADPELARRQFRAIRTSLLCAKARALARLERHTHADAALAAAVRACPRGAVDPLIVLEASKGLCLSLRGERATGAIHFDRALAACRAIGHRYHERWIERDKRATTAHAGTAPVETRPHVAVTDTALLLSDVSAILGAGQAIDLLAHRTNAILQSTTLADRVEVHSESGREYRPEPAATWTTTADGTFTIRLRGSDRLIAIHVRGVQSIEEISLMKNLADLVQVAVSRTADSENEDEDQNLWPRALPPGREDTVFRSPRMVELLRIAVRLASVDIPILIGGETGTGKEVFARLIHEHSKVAKGPFVPFNCSAMARELVESQLFGHRRGSFTGAMDSFPGVIRGAEKGTLFLDEIADVDLAIQPKFLRFLESNEVQSVGELKPQQVQVRIIAATNANLEDLVADGRFRSDLFYRLNVAKLALPPLRERKDEIPALASLFLERYSRECHRSGLKLGDDAVAALLLYNWPGNIRQLGNEIRRVVAMSADGRTIESTDFAPEIIAPWNNRPTSTPETASSTISVRADQTLEQAISELEQHFIRRAMDTAGGRVAEAAQLLGLSRKGLFLKRRRRGLVGE